MWFLFALFVHRTNFISSLFLETITKWRSHTHSFSGFIYLESEKKIEELNRKSYAIEFVDLLFVRSNQSHKFWRKSRTKIRKKKHEMNIINRHLGFTVETVANWNDCIYFGVISWNKCRCRRWHKNISCMYYYLYTCISVWLISFHFFVHESMRITDAESWAMCAYVSNDLLVCLCAFFFCTNVILVWICWILKIQTTSVFSKHIAHTRNIHQKKKNIHSF